MNTIQSPPPLFVTCTPLVLASGSPRRKKFFDELGLEYKVQVADVDEKPTENEGPEEYVKRLSLDKARAVSLNNESAWVVGADTVVVMGNKILGKPASAEDALQMLKMLRGKWHTVWTGFSVCNMRQDVTVQNAVKTEVRFWQLSTDVLQTYVATGEPCDKAGAYGIQGKGGFLVEEIRGSYSNVVGLPMAELIKVLLNYEVVKPAL